MTRAQGVGCTDDAVTKIVRDCKKVSQCDLLQPKLKGFLISYLSHIVTGAVILLKRYPYCILDLQSIPRESNKKDVAAMLVELTIEANEESFVIVHQHGGNDITCKSRI